VAEQLAKETTPIKVKCLVGRSGAEQLIVVRAQL